MTDGARVTLLTDFGTSDGYVAAMKAVIARDAPGVRVEDAGHDVPRGDVRAGAWALAAYWDLYPPTTVHVAVVDPGVGTGRRAIAIESRGRFLVGPDNGVLSPALREDWRGVELGWTAEEAPAAGYTFHGRDVFAPAAARLAAGDELASLGDPLSDLLRLEDPRAVDDGGMIRGEVVHVDRFGNLITNLPGRTLRGVVEVEAGGRRIPVCRSYGEAEPGELLALVDSFDRVEVACRDGSAAERLGSGRGDTVSVPSTGGRPG